MLKNLLVIVLLFSLAFGQQGETVKQKAAEVEEKVEQKVEEVVEAVKEAIKPNSEVAQTSQAQEEEDTLKYEDLPAEIQKALKKYHELNAKIAVLEAAPVTPQNTKELRKTQQKMVTYQQQLEQFGLSIEEATAQMNEYQEYLDKMDRQRVLYKYFEAQANSVWFNEHPKEVEDKTLFGIDKLKSKIAKLETKLAREQFKLEYISQRLENPDEYLKGTYIFQFSHTATQENIDATYALLAEKSIEVLHKYAIGNSFRGFSCEITDTDLPLLLDSEHIATFEAEGESTLFAQESPKFKPIFTAIHDACDVGTDCKNEL